MKALSKLQRYGLATISCGVALAAAWPIDAPVSCFLLAVMVSGLFGGLGPGLLSVGLSARSFGYFFLRRTLPPAVEPAIYLRFAVFLGAAFLSTGFMDIKRRVEESRNHAEVALRQAQADLARVSQVTTRVYRFASARSESTDCRCRHRRQYLLALAQARSPRCGRGMRGRVESRQRRNPCGGNHQPNTPAL